MRSHSPLHSFFPNFARTFIVAVLFGVFLLSSGTIFAQKQQKKALIIYYSWTGDTERAVGLLKDRINAPSIKVEPLLPYPTDYKETLGRARDEKKKLYDLGEYPEVSTPKASLKNIDTVYICYPVWIGKMAFPMQSYLRLISDQLIGKKVALITLSGKSPGEKTMPDAVRLCSQSKILGLLSIKKENQKDIPLLLNTFLSQIGD